MMLKMDYYNQQSEHLQILVFYQMNKMKLIHRFYNMCFQHIY